MRSGVNVFLRPSDGLVRGIAALAAVAGWVAIAVATALLAQPAFAEEARNERHGADRWLPSLAVISGVTVQEWNGTTRGTYENETADPEFVRPPDRGNDREVTPFVGGSLELMTPELPLPTSPRLFIGGDVWATFGFERAASREGSPGTIRNPLPEDVQGTTQYSESSALGQGSEVVAEVDRLAYGAHAGIAFPFELFGRQLRVKTSVAWIRYEIDVEGLIVDAECQPQTIFGGGCDPDVPPLVTPAFLRKTRLQASGDDTFQGIGPGLDLEMDTGRFGPVGTSIFFHSRLYKLLGDREIELTATPQPYDDVLGTGQATGRFTFEVDEWAYRVGLGLRLHWTGWE